MGFYLRKAFRFGPLRLNLSKGGLGISAGVKGLRIGTGPRGAYLHAGRGGLYVREYLSHHAPARETPSPGADRVPASFDDTAREPSEAPPPPVPRAPAITIAPGPTPHLVDVQAKRYAGGIFPVLGFGGILALVALAANLVPLASLFAGAAGIAAIVLHGADRRYAHALSRYTSHLLALLKTPPPWPPEAVQTCIQLREAGRFHPDHLQAIHAAAFRALLEATMQDGTITDPARQAIAQATGLLDLPDPDLLVAKVEAFRRHYLAAVSDHELTAEEDARLQQFETILGIPAAALAPELAMLAALREARRIRDGALQPIAVDVPLPDGERAYHTTRAQLLERRVLRAYVVHRVRQKEEGLVVIKAGSLYVTSRRLLLVGAGTTSFPLTKVLHVEVDPDQQQVTLTLDGRQRALVLAVPDPIVTGAMIERAAREAESPRASG
jgi:hypothetical protein